MAATVGGKYRLINKIGYGSFGDIYQGADDQDCPVAMKLERIEDSSLCVLKQEAAIYKALEDSPTIPKFLWYGSKGGYNILVMELLDKSLEELKHECGGTLSARTVLMLADQMISCLEYMHKKRIIHRDLKPENFMMRRGSGSGQVAIIDFGLSKTLSSMRSRAFSFCGTDLYRPPEMSQNAAGYNRALDWWQVGCVIYEMAVGVPPFNGSKEERRRKVLKEEPKYPEFLSTELVVLLKGLLRKNPWERLGAGDGDYLEVKNMPEKSL